MASKTLPAATLLLMIFCHCLSGEEPWGKDAALIHRAERKTKSQPCRGALGDHATLLIAFHQEVISPADGPRSHYRPSSSQYTRDAIAKYGFFRGFIMGCDRLMRENSDPWIYPTCCEEDGIPYKWDPVR